MKKTSVIGIALGTALILSGCAAGGNLSCDRFGCDGGARVDVGPIGGSFGAGVDRHGAGAGAGIHVGGARLSVGGDIN